MEQNLQLASLLKDCTAEIGVSLGADQVGKFMLYLGHLRAWNQSVNLTGITADDEIIVKHFVDSLAGLRTGAITAGARLLDVGSGAGFPGIPLRIVRDDLDVTLVEPVQKKISFLHFMIGVLRLERVRVFYGTLEQFMVDRFSTQQFDCIVTRALKYGFILRNSGELLANGGKVMLYLSQPIDRSELERDWEVEREHHFDLPHGFGRRVISVLSRSAQFSV